MIVIIDGYNMLHQIFPGTKGKLEKEKKKLIKYLSLYKSIKNNDIKSIIIVFDAGPLRCATREISHGVVVMHSGQASSADEWILNYVKKNKEQEFIIVTRDREIIDSCKSSNTQSIDGQSFYELVTQAIITSNNHPLEIFYDQQIKKFNIIEIEDLENAASATKSNEFDILMEQSTSNIPLKREYADNEKKHLKKSDKLSKKEKKIYSAIKKLL